MDETIKEIVEIIDGKHWSQHACGECGYLVGRDDTKETTVNWPAEKGLCRLLGHATYSFCPACPDCVSRPMPTPEDTNDTDTI